MSQTVNADSGPVITASQIDYKQSMYSHSSYRMSPQFSNTFGRRTGRCRNRTGSEEGRRRGGDEEKEKDGQ